MTLRSKRFLSHRPSVFRDLAYWMIGLGISVGVFFPLLILVLGVPASIALRAGFWTACVSAGILVGFVNYVIARGVFVRRLRMLTTRMRKVQKALNEVAAGGDLAGCEPSSCHLPVDSADELGTVATAFNQLLDAVLRAHTAQHASAELVTTVARARNEPELCVAALNKLLEYSKAAGGAIAITDGDAIGSLARVALPADLDVEELARAAARGADEVICPGGVASLQPIRVGPEVIGAVALVDDAPADRIRRRLMAMLADSLGVALDALRLQQQLADTAVHDALTGLANRQLFLDRVAQALLRAKRSGRSPAVLVLDLDDFKTINDSLGHAAGDQLLTAVADRLRAATRAEDTPARFGGDEFAVLVEEAGEAASITALIDRLLGRLHQPVELAGRTVRVSMSIGLATPGAGATPQSMLRDADAAMYAAKRSGKGRARIFDPSLQAIAERQLNMKIDLANAVERGEFRVVYQPIVELRTGEVVGVEALLRWCCSQHGPIPPTEFIPVAEETGLIHSIGRWVLQQACTQTRAWQAQFPARPLYVAVNLSAVQFHDEQVLDAVFDALAESGLRPELLVLELTESVLLRNTDRVLRRLREFHYRGIRIALDDFGTGYSSLSYLARFPFDLIKIDKSFIDQLDGDNVLCAGVLQLTQTLGLTTVAEGVERLDQARRLTALRCDLAQGHLYSPPVPPDRISGLLKDEESCAAPAIEGVGRPEPAAIHPPGP